MITDDELLAYLTDAPRPVKPSRVVPAGPCKTRKAPTRLQAPAGAWVPEFTARPAALRGAALRAAIAERDRVVDADLRWPETWFGRPDPGEARACRRLMVAVLRVGLLDDVRAWLEAARAAVRKGAEWRAASDMAFRCHAKWLPQRDFAEICSLAGFDPQAVRDRVRAAGASQDVLEALHRSLMPHEGRNRWSGGAS